jgi:hypothetical protein
MRGSRQVVVLWLMVLLCTGLSAAENPTLSSLALGSASVVGGNSVEATVTLDMVAPFDLEVSLAADPPEAAHVPRNVVVPAGAKGSTFSISTQLSKNAVSGSDATVTIYANYGVTRKASVSLLAPVSFDRMVDQVVEREREFVATMKSMHPLVETYVQNLHEEKDHMVLPTSDQYFLGRLDLSNGPSDQLFEKDRPGFGHHFSNLWSGILYRGFVPAGFAQMVMLDADFQKGNYYFNYVRQEFLGEVRCIVVDVQPKETAPKGLFTGRIWVEDRDFNIVRFNGTYTARSRYSYYLHFDSWRLNLQPGLWLPAFIYSEESDNRPSTPPLHRLYFKAQTRLWSYDVESLKHNQEFTQIQVDTVQDHSESGKDASPVEAERMWERLAEDNALDHLQKVGLVAPAGDVDKVLQTVVNNLIITNSLEIAPSVRCRVLLTSPLESFTIGHTIVVSRGLLDVLPDEASLAMILAHELSHIALGHRINTNLAFNDRFFFPDQNTFQRLDFERNASDETDADHKALELLANSPYKDKLANAGLFLKALQSRAPELTNLIRPHLGNRLGTAKTIRMSALLDSAPQLEPRRIDQTAALPLGGRIKLDPWSNRVQLANVEHVTLLSAQEKMPFEVAPFFPYLSRLPGVQIEAMVSK